MMKRLVRGIIVLILLLAVLLGVAAWLGNLSVFSVFASSSDEKVVQSISREEEVVLLRLGIQGIAEEKVATEVFGQALPGSGRAHFLKYKYSAMLGVDGAEVSIEKVADKKFRVSVPEFAFLGHSDVSFETAVEENGVISFLTPEIDVPQTVTKILNNEAKDQHIQDNREILEDQCKNFYTSIIHGVDPGVELEFDFAGS